MNKKVIKVSKQPYRLWFEFLKTCLNDNELNKKVDRDFYKSWSLKQVKTDKFDIWWRTHSHMFDQFDTEMSTFKSGSNMNPDNVYIQIPKNYSVKRVQKEIGALISNQMNQSNAKFKITSKRPLQVLKFDQMLWCWQWKQEGKYQLHEIFSKLSDRIDKRNARYEKNRSKTKITKRFKPAYETGDIQVSKNIRKVNRILKNVCKGVFPGEYSVS